LLNSEKNNKNYYNSEDFRTKLRYQCEFKKYR